MILFIALDHDFVFFGLVLGGFGKKTIPFCLYRGLNSFKTTKSVSETLRATTMEIVKSVPRRGVWRVGWVITLQSYWILLAASEFDNLIVDIGSKIVGQLLCNLCHTKTPPKVFYNLGGVMY
jgi:hypothetical protein